MAYLTRQLAFSEADAAQALSKTSGSDLGEALDYLCLHTDEAGLRNAFRRGSGGDVSGGAGPVKGGAGGRGAGGRGKGRKVLVAAPEPTIEVMMICGGFGCIRRCRCRL